MAQNAAGQPFQLPIAPVAGFNPTQQQAFQQYTDLQGQAQPYYNQAATDITGSAAPITGSDVSQYYNPYASAVMANLAETQGQQMQDLTGRSTQTAGGVGADRIGVAQAELGRQQNLATGQTASSIYQNALQAAEMQKQMQANAGYGFTNLGTTVQNASLQGTGALLGAGNQQQGQTQAQLNAPYQNTLAALAYPFQTSQYLAGVTGNLAGPLGGTTTGYGNSVSTPPQPSIYSQILGAGVAGAGAYGALGGGSNIGGMNATGSGSPTDSQSNMYAISQGINPWATSARGGVVGYAAGGSTGSGFGNPEWMDADPVVPQIEMHPTSGQSHNNLNLNPPQQSQQSSSGGIGDIISSVAKIAPLFLASSGGTVDANAPPFQPFEEGGDTSGTPFSPFDNRWADAATMGEMPRGMALNHYLSGPDAFPTPPSPEAMAKMAPPPQQPPPPPPDVVNPDQPIRMDTSGKMMGNMTSNQGQPPAPELPPVQNVAAMGAPGAGGPMSRPPPPQQERYSLDKQLPYPDLDAVHDTSREFAKSPWTALMNAGFAMMAGTSPFAGVNIGKGMLAGTKTLEDQRKELATEEGINQHAKQLMQQAQFHQDQYEKMTVFQKAEIQNKQDQMKLQAKLYELRGWMPIGQNDVEGTHTMWLKGTNQTMITHADGTVEYGSLNDPGKISKNPDTITKDNTPSGSSTPPEAAPLGQPELASNLVPPKVNTSGYYKGSPALAQANKENAAVTAQNAKEAATLGNQENLLTRSKQAYGVLMKDSDKDGFFTKLATMHGNSFDERIAAARSANELRRAAGQPPSVNPEKLAAMEVIAKDQNTLGMLFSSNISSREAFAGQQVGISSTPGLTQSPLGMLKLLGGMESMVQYTKDKQAFYENYIKENKGIPTGWQQAFQKQNPVDRYIVRGMMENLPDRQWSAKLPEAVKTLKEHRNDPNVVAGFNKRYGNTASYWLTGHLDTLGAQ